MDQVNLSATPRTDKGTRPSRRLRLEGFVPAVVYGRDVPTVPISVSARELSAVLHTEAGANALISVEVDGGPTVLTVAREVQRHPARGHITHLDFIKVSLDLAIEAEVSVEYVGNPVGVRQEGGFVEMIAATVLVSALPAAIPSGIEMDISDLNIGDTLKVADLPKIDGVEFLDELDRPLVTVLQPRAEEEPEVEEVEGDLEEGEEGAEGAEGEEPGREAPKEEG